MTEATKHEKRWTLPGVDGGFEIRARWKDTEYGPGAVDFDVWEIVGTEGVTTMYGNDSAGATPDIDTARRFMTLQFKFDGCSNWTFYPEPQDSGQALHFCCGMESVNGVCELLKFIGERAREIVDRGHW